MNNKAFSVQALCKEGITDDLKFPGKGGVQGF